MRPLVAEFGEAAVREHAVQVLGYPAVLCHTMDEAIRIRRSIQSQSQAKSKHKEN